MDGEGPTTAPAESGSGALRRWRWVVGLGLLGILVAFTGPRELYATLLRVSPRWALVTLGVAALWLFLGGFNVWLLLRLLAPVRLRLFLPIYLMSWAMTNVLPSQLGDVTQVVLLKRYGVPASKSGAAYLLDKLISVAWMSMVAAYGIGLYTASLSGWWLLALPFVGVLGGLAALWLLRRWPLSTGGRVERLRTWLDHVVEQLGVFRRHPHLVALNVLLTIVKWATVGLKYLCAFYAFGTLLPFVATATIPVVSSLVGYLPVTVGGIGTTEWTATALFARAGAEAATVVGVYLFLRGILLLAAAILVLLFKDRVAREVEQTSAIESHRTKG